jgi:hypothetical protein
VNSLPTGAPLYRANLSAILSRYQSGGLLPQQSSIVEPSGDVFPPPARTIRTTNGMVTLE